VGDVLSECAEPLRAFNPTVGLSYDRAFGSAITASFGGDPFSLFSKNDSGALTRQIDLHGDGAKSFENDFYRASGGVITRSTTRTHLLRSHFLGRLRWDQGTAGHGRTLA